MLAIETETIIDVGVEKSGKFAGIHAMAESLLPLLEPDDVDSRTPVARDETKKSPLKNILGASAAGSGNLDTIFDVSGFKIVKDTPLMCYTIKLSVEEAGSLLSWFALLVLLGASG